MTSTRNAFIQILKIFFLLSKNKQNGKAGLQIPVTEVILLSLFSPLDFCNHARFQTFIIIGYSQQEGEKQG